MSEIEKTNGDRVAPVIAGVRKNLADLAVYAREHPDEVVVAAVPVVAMAWATSRHDLKNLERFVVIELAYWSSVFAVKEYRAWKARPARPLPKLRRVI